MSLQISLVPVDTYCGLLQSGSAGSFNGEAAEGFDSGEHAAAAFGVDDLVGLIKSLAFQLDQAVGHDGWVRRIDVHYTGGLRPSGQASEPVHGHKDLLTVDGQVLVTPDAVVKTVSEPADMRSYGRVGESAGGVKFPPALDGIESVPELETRRTALRLLVDAYNALEARAGTNDSATVTFGTEAGDVA